jgi:DNA-binding HxlR family transcriptional regulator
MQFMDMARHIDDISPKILVKDLEHNHLITRPVTDTMRVTVEYELTDFGKTLHKVTALCQIGA